MAKTARMEFESVGGRNCFLRLQKIGFFDIKLALPFIVASVPAAFIGGYLRVDSTVYDILLSLTLVFASWKIYSSKKSQFSIEVHDTPRVTVAICVGFAIGFLSGIIGVGGGFFFHR